MYQNLTRDELPRTLFPVKRVPITVYRPDLYKKAVESEPTLRTTRNKQHANLAPYRGRTPEGRRRSMANLRVPIKMEEPTIQAPAKVAEGIPAPNVPTAIPSVPPMSLAKGRFLRSVLSQQEYDLYIETWNRWLTTHREELISPEGKVACGDLDDIHRICMEEVIMFRLDMLRLQYPAKYDKEYQNAFKRQQKARENLFSRRRDRMVNKPTNNTTNINIAVMAGMTDPKAIEERRQAKLKHEQSMAEFLESTIPKVVEGELLNQLPAPVPTPTENAQ